MLKESLYKGKKVFVGIDVHKKTYAVSCFVDGVITKKWSMQSDPASLLDQLKKNFKGAQITTGYEAGFSGFNLHRLLFSNKIKSCVIHTPHIQTRANDKVKTDTRDSAKIAEQLSTNQIKSIYIPTQEEEQRRSVSRGRDAVVRRRISVSNELKMKLYYLGVDTKNIDTMSEKFLKKIEQMKFSGYDTFHIGELIGTYRELSLRIKRYNKMLEKQANEDSNTDIYESIPGVGIISSRILANELGNMKRFKNERQLFSYLGLTPGERSSGEKIRRTSMTKQGSSHIRKTLIEIAWRAISVDKNLLSKFGDLSYKIGKQKAIVAIARILVGRLRSCLIKKELYVLG